MDDALEFAQENLAPLGEEHPALLEELGERNYYLEMNSVLSPDFTLLLVNTRHVAWQSALLGTHEHSAPDCLCCIWTQGICQYPRTVCDCAAARSSA